MYLGAWLDQELKNETTHSEQMQDSNVEYIKNKIPQINPDREYYTSISVRIGHLAY